MTDVTKWEPPAELWALLRPEIVAIARDEAYWDWSAYTKIPIMDSDNCWKSDGGWVSSLEALNLPEIPAAESLFIRPWRKGECDV